VEQKKSATKKPWVLRGTKGAMKPLVIFSMFHDAMHASTQIALQDDQRKREPSIARDNHVEAGIQRACCTICTTPLADSRRRSGPGGGVGTVLTCQLWSDNSSSESTKVSSVVPRVVSEWASRVRAKSRHCADHGRR
jgi:hypothetical protein